MPNDPCTSTSGPLIEGLTFRVGNDVGADDILAPQYLSFDLDDPEERRWLGAYALAHQTDQPGPFVRVGEFRSPYSIILAGRQFGHGSARIHSPLALAEAGVRCVVADTIAPGFMRAAINGGLLHCLTLAASGAGSAIESGAHVVVDLDRSTLRSGELVLPLDPEGVARQIVDAGGLAACLKAGGPR